MAIRFLTLKDSTKIKEYLDKLSTQQKYFDLQLVLFTVTSEEVAIVESSCITIVKELENIVPFFVSSTAELYAGDVPVALDGDVDNFKDKSLCMLLKSGKKSSYIPSTDATLTGIYHRISRARDSLEKFNSQHGYLFSVDIALLKKCEKSRSTMNAIDQFTKNSKGREDFINAINNLEASDIPSESLRVLYHSFLQASTTIMNWISSITDVESKSASLPVNGTVTYVKGFPTRRGEVYRLHDCTQLYEMFTSAFIDFFSADYQEFWEEVQGNVLSPEYISSFRVSLDDFLTEIRSLEALVNGNSTELRNSNTYPMGSHMSAISSFQTNIPSNITSSSDRLKILLNPSIQEFYFLYNTLDLFLSVSIHSDEVRSTKYFESTFELLSKNSDVILEKVKSTMKNFQEVIKATETNSPDIIRDKKKDVENCNFLYADLDRKVDSTIRRLEADLLRSRRILFTLDPLPSAFFGMTKELQDLELSLKDSKTNPEPTSWRVSVTSILKELFNVAICKAEYNPSAENLTDKNSFTYNESSVTYISTSFETKEMFLILLKQLRSRLEVEGVKMELEYRDIFFRSPKAKLWKNVEYMLARAEKCSVIFSSPSQKAA